MGKDAIDRYFGLAISYLMPGMIALYGLSYRVTDLRRWFGFVAERETTLAGFLFVMVASVGAGVMLSAVRSFVLEDVTTLAKPKTGDWSKRKEVEASYQILILDHYNYYKCYGNTAVAVVVFGVCYFWANTGGISFWDLFGYLIGFIATVALLVYKALDCISRFEAKRGALLGWPKQA
jgi:hypothetical protein